MCGIAGITTLADSSIPNLSRRLETMSESMAHRGPDGVGSWEHPTQKAGFAHRRLSIIDIEQGSQPMTDSAGNWIVFNGEIYNYIELRKELKELNPRTHSDTEIILLAYRKWGKDCVNKFRGMFSFAIWDESNHSLFCARDRFGIKPFYYVVINNTFYFASEAKSLLPFLPEVEIATDALQDYLTFQLVLGEKTLFKGVSELLPAHSLTIINNKVTTKQYWEVYYNIDLNHTKKYFEEKLEDVLEESLKLHLRSDVPIGAYVSGGIDSSYIAALASIEKGASKIIGFTGKFEGSQFDESQYARDVANKYGFTLEEQLFTADDFIANIESVTYHLDYPVAGPGSFAQYMVSKLAAKKRKVLLGGQGGDEIFGGYTRYLVAYFEQCIKGAIEGTLNNGKYVVTYESIISGLGALEGYKPMIRNFWKDGVFENLDKRYFRLINRAPEITEFINWEHLPHYEPFEHFLALFQAKNVAHESYFDSMTHFDFKTLLPALLQVEDRVSMAHGLESRVPLLDHKVVELAATIPANMKLDSGDLKHIFRRVASSKLPSSIMNRNDKMGFPVPLNDWVKNDTNVREYVMDLLNSQRALSRAYIDNKKAIFQIENEGQFGRTFWAILSLELWSSTFLDNHQKFSA